MHFGRGSRFGRPWEGERHSCVLIYVLPCVWARAKSPPIRLAACRPRRWRRGRSTVSRRGGGSPPRARGPRREANFCASSDADRSSGRRGACLSRRQELLRRVLLAGKRGRHQRCGIQQRTLSDVCSLRTWRRQVRVDGRASRLSRHSINGIDAVVSAQIHLASCAVWRASFSSPAIENRVDGDPHDDGLGASRPGDRHKYKELYCDFIRKGSCWSQTRMGG